MIFHLSEITYHGKTQEGRGLFHIPPTHCNWLAPTNCPWLHSIVATVPSVKSALLNETDAFLIAFSMFQQFTEKVKFSQSSFLFFASYFRVISNLGIYCLQWHLLVFTPKVPGTQNVKNFIRGIIIQSWSFGLIDPDTCWKIIWEERSKGKNRNNQGCYGNKVDQETKTQLLVKIDGSKNYSNNQIIVNILH